MNREVKTTEDGSKTLFINEMNEGYHSSHGALQEAIHVFIKNGFNLKYNCGINILELGFGTGLNLMVTISDFLKKGSLFPVHYFALEKYPVLPKEITELNYASLFDFENAEKIYRKAHECEWSTETELLPNFFLTKFETDFFQLRNIPMPGIDLVYFDCFGARVQPDLWEKPLFERVAEKMNKEGLLTTYSSKGSVRRLLKELDFLVEKKPGPPGKREMTNAIKQ